MRARAVIFDMDGLLIDTEPIWRRVQREVFRRIGIELSEEEALSTMGVPVREIVQSRYPVPAPSGPSQEAVVRQIVDGVIAHVQAEGTPLPGVRHAFDLVHAAGIPIAIASSSSCDLIEAVVEHLGLSGDIQAMASAEHEVAGKPHPAVYLAAARLLHVLPQQCVALEDSPNGVLSAKAAGMRCIAIPDPHMADDPRMDAADLRLPSLEALTLDMLDIPDSVGCQ